MLRLNDAPTVDAVELPCKIGDYVWAIRNFHGHKHPQRGVVSDMYFTRGMELNIAVKYVARGKWGETVFATDKEAYAVINGGQAPQRKSRSCFRRGNGCGMCPSDARNLTPSAVRWRRERMFRRPIGRRMRHAGNR